LVVSEVKMNNWKLGNYPYMSKYDTPKYKRVGGKEGMSLRKIDGGWAIRYFLGKENTGWTTFRTKTQAMTYLKKQMR